MSGISPFNSNYFNPFTSRLSISSAGDWSNFVRDVQSDYRNSFLDLSKEDYFSNEKNPKINDLFKSIAAQTADELLDLGYEKDMAITRSVEEYIKGLSIGKASAGPVAQTNKNLVVTDQAGQSSFLNYQDIAGNTLNLNAGTSDDVINLGGDKNLVILNLEEGNNLVNIDDEKDSDFVVLGGNGEDKITLSGNISDYQFNDNGDDTLTIKNLISGATTTVDNSIGEIGLNDGSKLVFKDGKLTITASENADVLNLNGDNTTYDIDSLEGYDSVYVGGEGNTIDATLGGGKDMAYIDGSNNIVNLALGSKSDRVYIAAGDNNVINIDGGSYTDNIILQGQESDWTIDAAGAYVNNVTGTTVNLSNAENIYFASDVNEAQDLESNIDLTAYENTSLVLNISDEDDVINAGGIGNDMVINLTEGNNTVNVDDSNVNVFYVNAEAGDNTVNLTGNLGDYRFQDNKNGTYSIINNDSYAQIIVDEDVNRIKFADESEVTFDGEKFNVEGTIYSNSVNIDGSGNTYTVSTYNGNDDVYVGGENNNVDILLHNDDDSVFVTVGKNNNITIDGAHGTDSITLQGMEEDWTLKGDGSAGSYYLNAKSGTKVTMYTGIENVSFDNAVVYYDEEDHSAALDFTGYDDTDIVINTGDKDDTINLDGSGNTVDISLVAGDNVVNIDDTEGSTYTIVGGTGSDTLNLVDDFSNYEAVYNADDTVTLTNTVSGTVINLDPNTIETLTFNGEVVDPFELDGITIDGTSDDDTINVNQYDGEKITINAYAGNDTVNVSGLGNETTINITSGESTINIDDSEMSTYTVNGGSDADVVTLAGNVADYSVVDNGDGSYSITNNVSGTTIDISNVELVEVQDGVLLGDAGTVTVEETSSTVTLDGTTGNDAFAIDATDTSNYTINGGDGADSVALAGASTDWSFDRDTDTYTHNTTGQTIAINGVETVSYENSSDVVDVHSSAASLLGVTTDFNKLVAEEGASAGFAELSDIYGQIVAELTDQGLTDQALMFDKLRSSTHNMGVVAADYEEMILATGGDITALESIYYDHRNDAFTKPDDWDDTYYSWDANTDRDTVAYTAYATFAVGYAANEVWDYQDCLDKDYIAWEAHSEYENIMADATVSQDVKDLAKELFSSTGGMAESFQSVVTDITQKSPTTTSTYNSVYDVITGEEYHTKLTTDTAQRYENFDTYDAFNVTGFTGSLQSLASGEDYSNYTATAGSDNLEITSSFATIGGLDMLEGNDNVEITAHNSTIGSTVDRLSLGEGSDTLSLIGLNTDVYADMGAGDDTIFVSNSSPYENTIKSLDVLGGDGNDTLVLEGSSSDWTYDAGTSTYKSFNNETTVKVNSIENVVFADEIDGNSITINGTSSGETIDATGITSGEVFINAGEGADTIYIDNTNSTKYTIDMGGDSSLDEVITTDGFLDYEFIDNGDGSYTFSNATTGSEITLLNVGEGDGITNCDGNCAACVGECTFEMNAAGNFESYIQDLDGTDTEYLVTGVENLDYVQVHDSGGNDTLTLEGSSTDWTYDRNTDSFYHNDYGTQVELFNEIENLQFTDDMQPVNIGETTDINFSDVSLTGVTTDFNKLVADEGASAAFAHLSDLYGQLSTQLSDQGLTDQALMFDKLSSATNNMSVVARDYEYLVNLTGGDEAAMADLWNARNDDFTKPVGWDDTYYDFDANTTDTSIQEYTYSVFTVGYATNADATTMANALAQDKIAYEAYDTYDSIMNDATLSQEIKDLTTELFSATGNMGETFQNKVGDIVFKEPDVASSNTTFDVITGESYNEAVSADMAVRYDDFVNYDAYNVTGFTSSLQNISTGEDYSSYVATTGDDNLEIAGGFTTIGSVDMLDGNDVVEITAHNSTVGTSADRVNLGAGEDTLIMTGFNTDAFVDMGTGDDTIYVGGGTTQEYNTIKNLDVLGGDGNDTLILEGSSSDWTFNSATQTYHTYSDPDTEVKIDSIENVLFSEDMQTITGTASHDTIDATGFVNQDVTINALSGQDSIYLEDSTFTNDYTINLGSDNSADHVYVEGSIDDYSVVDNGDGSFTLTNSVSGSTITLDQLSNPDYVHFDDAYMLYSTDENVWDAVMQDDASDNTFTVNPEYYQDILFNADSVNDTMIVEDSISNWTHSSDTRFYGAPGESIEFDGLGTIEFDDYVAIKAGATDDNIDLTGYDSSKDINVVGGDGNDAITLAGSSSDWAYDSGTSTYTNNTSGQTVKVSGIETVNFAEAGPPSPEGAADAVTITGTIGSNTIDATGYNDTEITIDALGGNDIINVDGSGNTNIIDSGTGNDVINLLGSDSESTVSLGSGNDSIFVSAGEIGEANTVTLLGGTGDDTLTLEGAEIDWAYDEATSTYTNSITGTTVEATDFENVEYTQIGLTGNIDDYIIHDRVGDGVIKIEDRSTGDIIDAGDGDVIKFADGSVLELGVGNNTATITGTDSGSYVEVDDTFMSGIYNATLGGGDDTFILTGHSNTTDSDLGAGDDNVFISEGDIGAANHAVLEGGAGNDTLTLDGDADNWVFDGTDTYTNVHTGTTIQATGFENVAYQDNAVHLTGSIDDYIIHDRVDDGVIKIEDRSNGTTYDMAKGDIIEFEDGSRLKMDTNGFVAITNSDTGNLIEIDDTYGFGRYNATLGAGDDDFIMTGSKNLSDSNLGAGDDTAYISAGAVDEANNVVLNGGDGTDRLTLEGSATDWTFNGTNTYTHNTTGSTVQISNFENVRFEADNVTIDGTTGGDEINVDGYTNETITVNALAGQDYIYLDDSVAQNDFILNLGSDSNVDRVYVDGNIADYAVADNGDGTYTLTNNVSGSTITLNELSDSDSVYFADGRMSYELADDTWDIHITDTAADDNYVLNDISSFEDIHFNGGTSFNDTLVINDSITNWNQTSDSRFYEQNAGTDAQSIEFDGVGTIEFNDYVFIKSDSASDNIDLTGIDTSKDFRVQGGDGADSVTLVGSASDWTFDRATDTYTNTSTGQNIAIENVETVTYADSSDVIDIHSENASLLGVTTNFNNIVTTDGVAAAYSQISDMYGQLRDEMTAQGLTDQATTFDKMASAAYNQSLVAAEYEAMFDATGGDPTAIQALYDSRDTTLMTEPAGWDDTYYTFEEDTIKNYIYDMAPMGSAAKKTDAELATIVSSSDKLVYELYSEYKDVMDDALISDDVKALAQELTSANGNMGESFQNVVSNLIYIAPTSSNTNGINDAITGDSYQQFIGSGAEAHWESYDTYRADNVSSYTDGLINVATGEDYSSFTGTTGADNLNITTGFETIGSFDMGDGNDTLSIAGHNNDIGSSGDRVLMGAGNDTLNYDGFNNDSYIDMGEGDDMAFVRSEGRIDGNINTLDVTGGAGNDTLVLEGSASDWYAVDGDTYRSYNTNTTVNYSGFESIVYSDDGISLYDGTSGDDIYESTTNSNLGVVSTDDSQDYVAFSGDDNEVTIRLGGGSDLAEIDTSGSNSSYIVDAGTGYDALMLSGNIADYNFVDNGDGTHTITDINSGTTVTIDDTVEDVYAADGVLSDMGSDDYGLIVYNSNDQDLYLENYSDIAMEAYMEEGNDTVYLGGDNLQRVGLGDGDDTAYVDASEGGTFYVDGADGNDTVNLTGSLSDYIIKDTHYNTSGYTLLTNTVTGAEIQVENIDTINFEDGGQITDLGEATGAITGTSGNDVVDIEDIRSSSASYDANLGAGDDSYAIDGLDLNANVDLGSGNDSIYVNRGRPAYSLLGNEIVVDGNTGIDTLTLEGAAEEWTYDSGTSTYTNVISETTVQVSNIENVVYDDSSVVYLSGNVDDYTVVNYSNNGAYDIIDSSDNVVASVAGFTSVVFDNGGVLSVRNDEWNSNNLIYVGEGSVDVTAVDNWTYSLRTDEGNDNISLDGLSHWANINSGAGDDTISVAKGDINDLAHSSSVGVNGGEGYDTLVLEGAESEWVLNGTSYKNYATGSSVYISDIENVTFDDSDVIYASGSISDYSILDNVDDGIYTISGGTSYDLEQGKTVVFADGTSVYNQDGFDALGVGGSTGNDDITIDDNVAGGKHMISLREGDDSLSIDDSVSGNYDISGGDGVDTVYLSGDTSDYTVKANSDGSYNLTNTVSGAVIKIGSDVENVYDGFSTIMDLAGLSAE